MRKCVSAIREVRGKLPRYEASGDGGMMNWIPPCQMESCGPLEWQATGRRLLRGAKPPVRRGARAASSCRTPVEIKSTRARAKAPNGPQNRALRGVCSLTTREVSWSSSPATRKAGPRVPVVKDYVRAP
jgi:hypothetical protein